MVIESTGIETVKQYIESHKTGSRSVGARHKVVREFGDSNATRVVVLTQGKDFDTKDYGVDGNMKRLYAQDGKIKFGNEDLKSGMIDKIPLKDVTIYVIHGVKESVLHNL